jgi:Flp pilus assembly protein TadD
MNYFTGPDLMVRELIEEDRPKALELASALPNLFKGASAYAVYGWALAVNGDTAGARRQYAEAKRVFRPPVPDPTVKFKQVDERWYWLDQLVKCSNERGHTPAAVDIARLTAELYANNARAHATYGWALSESGDRKNAAAEIARALEIDPLETAALRLSRRILPADRR